MTQSRDFITPVQRGRLPAFVRSDYPAFEKYVIDYFRWLEQDGQALDILENWYGNTDADNMVEPYVSAILADLGWNWEGSLTVPKNLLLNNLRDFYLSRGTKKSFQFLFQALFGESVNIKYPRERMLVLNQADYATEARVFTTAANRESITLRAILEDLNARDNVEIVGLVSGTVATVETIQILLSGDKAYFQVSILEPLTDFVVKEDVRIQSKSGFIIERFHNVMTLKVQGAGIENNVLDEIVITGAGLRGVTRVTNLKGGRVDSINIVSAGEAYEIGDKIIAEKREDDDGFGFYAKVSAIDVNGEITGIEILDRGRGYRIHPTLYVKSAGGFDAEFETVSTTIGAIDRISILQPYVDFNPLTATASLGTAVFEIGQETIFTSRAYKDRRGVLGENSVLIDSDQYQQFSYDLVTGLSSNVHRQIVDELLHPVGYIRTDVMKIDKEETTAVIVQSGNKVTQGQQDTILSTISGNVITTLSGDFIGTL